MDWFNIDKCPEDQDVVFASFYNPSDHAAKNGARASWQYGTGRKIIGSGKMQPIYTGILGKPSHFAYLTQPA